MNLLVKNCSMTKVIQKSSRWGFFAFLLAVMSCSQARREPSKLASDGETVGRFKGYVAVDLGMRQRLLAPGAANHLSGYLGAETDEFSGLVSLLGGFSGGSGASQFRAGDPNAMNMVLWQMVLSLFSQDLAKSCDAPTPADALPLNSAFSARLMPLCSWPTPAAKTPENLQAFWLAVMGYAAPQAEFAAWRDYFLAVDSPYANAAPKDVVGAMLLAMFLNPNFLLAH